MEEIPSPLPGTGHLTELVFLVNLQENEIDDDALSFQLNFALLVAHVKP